MLVRLAVYDMPFVSHYGVCLSLWPSVCAHLTSADCHLVIDLIILMSRFPVITYVDLRVHSK